MGWYDHSFLGEDREVNQALWHQLTNDSKIKGFEELYYDDMHKEDIKKLERIYQKIDVMITHTCPFLVENGEPFYHFNGEKYLKDGMMKAWIYGHIHTSEFNKRNGVNLIVNALGRKNENRMIEPCQIEV